MSFGNSFERAMRAFRAFGGQFMETDADTVIAYVVHGDNVEFATAICAPHDTYHPAVGAAIAIERYLGGKTVSMRREDCVFLN